MARAKYGAFITEIKGKVGGTVMQSCKGGFMVRNAPLSNVIRSRNPPFQAGIINDLRQNQLNFSTVQKSWSQLTQAERDTWSSLVGIYTFTNKFGDPYNGTAFQIYTSINSLALIMEIPLLTSAPVQNLAFDPGFTTSDYSISGTWDVTSTNPSGVGQLIPSFSSRPVGASQPFSKARLSKAFIAVYAGAGTANIKPAYDAVFGAATEVGSVIYSRRWVSFADYPMIQYEQTVKTLVVA